MPIPGRAGDGFAWVNITWRAGRGGPERGRREFPRQPAMSRQVEHVRLSATMMRTAIETTNTTSPAIASKSHYEILDGLRGVAATMVSWHW